MNMSNEMKAQIDDLILNYGKDLVDLAVDMLGPHELFDGIPTMLEDFDFDDEINFAENFLLTQDIIHDIIYCVISSSVSCDGLITITFHRVYINKVYILWNV